MPKTKGMLLSSRPDRFGARLMSLVNTKRISDAYNIPFLVYWVQSTDIGSIFNNATELFAHDFVEQHFMTLDEWRSRLAKATRTSTQLGMTQKQFLDHISNGKDILFDMAFDIFSFPEEDPEQVRKDFVQAFNDIKKSPQVNKIFANLDRKMEGATAYHIRRGDLVDVLRVINRPFPKKFIPTQFYKYHIRKTLKNDINVVLFSDEKDTIQLYKEEFPAALSLPDLIGDTSLTDAGYDFLELYAMSHCSKIIAPKQSAFSAAAATLGNTPLVPLMEDFDAQENTQAFEELIEQLENPPEGDFAQGEIGQCLVHATDYLRQKGQKERAGRLMENWILRGLNISHIYSSACLLQNQLGNLESVQRIAEAADKGYVLLTKDKVTLEQCRVYASMQQGQVEDAIRHAQIAFWSEPNHAHNQAIVMALYQLGVFNETNAFPIDPEILAHDMRSGSYQILVTTYPELLKGLPEDSSKTLPFLMPAIWDWAYFLNNQRKPEKSDANRLLSRIEKIKGKSGEALWMRSYHGILETNFGDKDEAIRILESVFDQSGTALSAYRISYANWLRRNIPEMFSWAEKAITLSDAPIYKVWLANVLIRRKRLDEAEALLTLGVPPLDGFATVLEIEGNLWQQMGNTKKLIETYNKIEKLAPLFGFLRQKQAQALIDDGQNEAAFKAMRLICETEKATPVCYKMYIDLLVEAGHVDEAKSYQAIARHKYPRHNIFDNISLS